MNKEILNKNQQNLLYIVKSFSNKDFYLAGGTALALQINHRESIDFDLFRYESFDNLDIYKDLIKLGLKDTDLNVVIDKLDEYTLFINNVKFTFLRYPFSISDISKKEDILIASPLCIGAMKAYALGRRGKWKDYTDIYFLLQTYSLEEIIKKAKDIYGTLFSERMFLQQLCYFEDIDYTEQVIWKLHNPPSDEKIKEFFMAIVAK